MHPIRSAILFVVFVVLAPLSALAAPEGFAHVTYVAGDVQIRYAGSTDWVPAAVNTPLMEGDSVWAPEGSRAEIGLRTGTVLRLDRQSSLDLLRLDEDFQQCHLGMGRLYVRTGDDYRGSLQVDVSDSTVRVDGYARFRIDRDDQGNADISLYRGAAIVEGNDTRTRVRSGEVLSLEEAGNEMAPLNPPDEWEEWNEARDRQFFAAGVGTDYLPDELDSYAGVLDANGEWVDVPEYGYVWRPYVETGVDWAPYRLGRWVWIGGDYVWVSSESWGWAPYHYGRWIDAAGFGWCWVPPSEGDVYWGPGYVGWVVNDGTVGWVPLAPREIYYGRGYYGRHSVDLRRAGIRREIDMRRVRYTNMRLRNAVTVMPRGTFASGRGRPVPVREGGRERWRPAAGRPDIRPVGREIRMPVVRSVPPAVRPPARVRNTTVNDLRTRFPRIEERPAIRPVQPRQPVQQPPAVRPFVPREGGRYTPAPERSREPVTRPARPEPMERPVFRPVPGQRPERAPQSPARPQVPQTRRVWHFRERDPGKERPKSQQQPQKKERQQAPQKERERRGGEDRDR